jgi:hypothetical protein
MGNLPIGDNRPLPKGLALVQGFMHFFKSKKGKVHPDIVPVGLTRRAPMGNSGRVSPKMNVATHKAGPNDRGASR